MSRSFCVLVVVLFAASSPAEQQASHESKLIARGKYLVTDVGMCGDCHSPHNQQGEEIPGRQLQGSPLDFQPLHPVPGWASVAPPLAGLEGWTRNEAVHFLMTGVKPDGKRAAPPMPQYRLSRNDAEAVVAYLKSLKASR
jgi:mono/diheme cytochrome c family protein